MSQYSAFRLQIPPERSLAFSFALMSPAAAGARQRPPSKWLLLVGLLTAGLFPWATALSQPVAAQLTPFSKASGDAPPAPWRVLGIPGKKKPVTAFSVVSVDGRQALKVEADNSYGNLVHELPAGFVPGPDLKLHWAWRVDRALPDSDLRRRETDDSPLKVCALFDQPLERLGLLDRTLLGIARATTSENLPSATLCYVWDAKLDPGTLLANAYTSRVRMIVVDAGKQGLGKWTTQSRDLNSDFRRAFGDEGATVPALTAVLVGADADNTGGHSLGYVSDLTLAP
jgi:hypothetical protein